MKKTLVASAIFMAFGITNSVWAQVSADDNSAIANRGSRATTYEDGVAVATDLGAAAANNNSTAITRINDSFNDTTYVKVNAQSLSGAVTGNTTGGIGNVAGNSGSTNGGAGGAGTGTGGIAVPVALQRSGTAVARNVAVGGDADADNSSLGGVASSTSTPTGGTPVAINLGLGLGGTAGDDGANGVGITRDADADGDTIGVARAHAGATHGHAVARGGNAKTGDAKAYSGDNDAHQKATANGYGVGGDGGNAGYIKVSAGRFDASNAVSNGVANGAAGITAITQNTGHNSFQQLGFNLQANTH